MSISIMTAVWKLQIKTTEKLCLLALADMANDDGVCWPGRAKLADKVGITERSLKRVRASLEEQGFVDVLARSGEDGRQKSNVFHLNVGMIQAVAEGGGTSRPPWGEGDAQAPGEGDAQAPLGGDIQAPQNHNKETPDRTITISCEKSPSQFQRFRDCWPKGKWTGGRAKPLEFWNRHNLDEIADIIIADVQARARDDRKWRDGFIPNPMTYLNQRRWEDDIDTGLGPRRETAEERQARENDDFINGRTPSLLNREKTINGEVIR